MRHRVALPAFARRHVALRRNAYLTHYRSAFAFSAILYPHSQQLPLRVTCPCGRKYGLTVFPVSNMNGLGFAYSPVAPLSVCPYSTERVPRYMPFWLKPISAFGLSCFTMFISNSPGLTMPSSLAPHPHRHSQMMADPSRDDHCLNQQGGLHCPGSFTPHRYQ